MIGMMPATELSVLFPLPYADEQQQFTGVMVLLQCLDEWWLKHHYVNIFPKIQMHGPWTNKLQQVMSMGIGECTCMV